MDNNADSQASQLADDDRPKRVGEEDVEGRSTPGKDLVAAGIVLALSVFAMFLAVRLKNPGSIQTHPGMLPFLTGLTLFAMAAGIGLPALRDGGAQALFQARNKRFLRFLDDEEGRRLLLLIGIIVLYVLAADLITFDLRYPTSLFVFRFSSYELVSMVALGLILRIFWKAPLWQCGAVSVVFVIALTSIFRYGFHILLPGAD